MITREIELDKTRVVHKASKGLGHIYLPSELIGCKVVSIVIKEPELAGK